MILFLRQLLDVNSVEFGTNNVVNIISSSNFKAATAHCNKIIFLWSKSYLNRFLARNLKVNGKEFSLWFFSMTKNGFCHSVHRRRTAINGLLPTSSHEPICMNFRNMFVCVSFSSATQCFVNLLTDFLSCVSGNAN